MSKPHSAPDRRDTVQLRAVFVADGQVAPPELVAGMVDVVRLSVRLPLGAGEAMADASGGTDEETPSSEP